MGIIYDNWGRLLSSARIQVNTSCNLNCSFCHMEGVSRSSNTLSPDEIEKIIQAFRSFEVNKIKFTGGEPLMRSDIIDIVRRARRHITGDISMTTNGILLPRYSTELKRAGLDRLNISMHGADEETVRIITGSSSLSRIKDGVLSAIDAGFKDIKLNFVVLRDLNESSISDMVEFASEYGLTLQLIELQSPREDEDSAYYRKYHHDLVAIEKEISSRAIFIGRNSLHYRPVYTIIHKGKTVKVEIVRPMHNPLFCSGCTRLRVTSTGKLKTCLLAKNDFVDIRSDLSGSDWLNRIREKIKIAMFLREPYWRKTHEVKNNVFCKIEGSGEHI